MEGLDLDNILDSNDIENLFVDEETQETSSPETEEENKEKEKSETTEVNTDNLFTDEPESVGSEEETIEEKEDTTSKQGGTSPNLYSSIAKACKEEGIFPTLDDDVVSKVSTPEDFRDLIEQLIQSGLDERQKRIDDALNARADVDEVRKYENIISYFDSLEEDTISDEGDKGETLRKQLIYQDFINRGYSKERAEREVNKSFNAGTDIEDAKEALKSNKEFFQDSYNNLIKEALEERKQEEKQRKAQAEELKKSILEEKKVFGDIEVDKKTRQQVFDNISKPIYKDPETGELYTAIQKYEMEHRTDFLKNVSLLYTLTNGFKDINALVKGKVRKEVKKGFKELEHTINNTARTSDGNLVFASGVNNDSDSYSGKGWTLDV